MIVAKAQYDNVLRKLGGNRESFDSYPAGLNSAQNLLDIGLYSIDLLGAFLLVYLQPPASYASASFLTIAAFFLVL